MKGDYNDPKALIRESFNIEGIKIEECRSIFLDWALSLPNDVDTTETISLLLEKYVVVSTISCMSRFKQKRLELREDTLQNEGCHFNIYQKTEKSGIRNLFEQCYHSPI
jgi:hypothetical protein